MYVSTLLEFLDDNPEVMELIRDYLADNAELDEEEGEKEDDES